MPPAASLTPSRLAVEPGRSASFTLEVAAGGRIEVLGPVAEWAVVVPPEVSVPPGGGTVRARVVVQVPRSPRVAPGPSPVDVRVGDAEASATVDVLPFADVRASLSPRVSRGRSAARHTLHVENLGNQRVDATLDAVAGDGGLRVDLERPSLTVGPGEAVAVPVRVEARRRRLVGPARRRPFGVAVRAGGTAATTDGLLVHERTRWPLPVAVVVLALVSGLAVAGRGGSPGPRLPVPTTLAAAVPAQAAECPPELGDPAAGDLVVQNFLFCPVRVSVAPGAELRWSNRDAAPHTVSADGDEFDTGNFGRGEVRSVRFDRPGTYHYFCRLHPFMRGTVVVA